MSQPAASKGGRPRKLNKPKTVTTKLSADLHKKVRLLVAHRGVEMFDYLDALLRPAIERDYDRVVRELGGGK